MLLFLDNVREHHALIAPTGDEYHATIKDAAAGGVVGGTIYDALIARCALKAKADTIYTWNTCHFQRFGTEIVNRLQMP